MSHSLNSYIDRELFVTTAHDKWIKKSWVSTTRVNEIRKSFLVIRNRKKKMDCLRMWCLPLLLKIFGGGLQKNISEMTLIELILPFGIGMGRMILWGPFCPCGFAMHNFYLVLAPRQINSPVLDAEPWWLWNSQISGEAVLCTIFSLWLMHVFFGAFFSQKVSILVLQNFSACDITLVLFPLHFLPEDYSSQGQLTFSLEFNWLTFLLPGAALMIEFDKSRTVSKPVFVNFSV